MLELEKVQANKESGEKVADDDSDDGLFGDDEDLPVVVA